MISRPLTLTADAALIIAPHQDDETLGCGGLIAQKRQRGAKVSVVFVTDGSKCHGELTGADKTALVALRRAEAIAALTALEVPKSSVSFLNFPDGALSTLPPDGRAQVVDRLSEIIKHVSPKEIYMPHHRDSHPDHEAAYALTKEAAQKVQGNIGKPFALYEYIVWLLWSRNRLFQNIFWSDLKNAHRLSVGPVRAQKQAAMEAYPSQLALLPPGFAEWGVSGDEFFFPVRLDNP